MRIAIVKPKVGFEMYDENDNQACLELRPGGGASISAGRC